MTTRLVNEGVLVVRNGKRVQPTIGKAFKFTADEINQIERVRPQAISRIETVQVDESGDDGSTDTKDPSRDELINQATEMGLTFAKNVSTKKLAEMIESAQAEDDL